MKRVTKAKLVLLEVILLPGSFLAGFILRGEMHRDAGYDRAEDPAGASDPVWTCSMHPRIKLPKAGQCPICFMDLIPLDTGDDDEHGLRELSVSENAAKRMEIETVPVERRFVSAEVRMVGKVDYDETRVSAITAWVPGRLDRLFVDYTGVSVKKGDPMVSLYSPELLSAQEERLQAIRAAKAIGRSDEAVAHDMMDATVEATGEKLRRWGLTPEQITGIEERGKPDDHITIHAPSGGIVIHKNAQEGMYVQTGARIYTIADLSRVWVNLDAYESDLQWLKYGQKITFTTEAYPGETFAGTISFIQPMLDEATRTVKVRVNVANGNGRLKPGMFVRAVAEAAVATGGRIMDAALGGKWISPMHPEVVKDGPGECDVCGMPLVRAESLGYVGAAPTADDKPLVIPAAAPLLTGKRAIVYVAVPGADRPTFEGREIVLGPRAGDAYLVVHGLAEGDRVVTKGNFKLDAELQIRAKPSMMTPPVRAVDPEFQKQLAAVVKAYLKVQEALAADDYSAAAGSAKQALTALDTVDTGLVEGDAHMAWMKSAGELKSLFPAVADAVDIAAARATFARLSEEMDAVIARFGVAEGTLFKAWCPMAFDNRGASWIQSTEEVNNPYFGAMMLRCGEIKEVLK